MKQFRGMPVVDLVVIKPKELQKLRVVLRKSRFKHKYWKPVKPLSKESLNAIIQFEATEAKCRRALKIMRKSPGYALREKQLIAEHKLRQKQYQVENVKGLMVAKCAGTSRKKCPKCGGRRVKIWTTIVTLDNRCGKRLLCPTCGWTNGRTDGNG